MEFTDREFQIINDQDFLQTKSTAISKIHELLTEVKFELHKTILHSRINRPLDKKFLAGKISKGENYRGLPYLVLDYPAVFLKDDIFAFRTMFWWGNFFSCSFHLQGKMLELYRNEIIHNISQLANKNIFLCVNQTPWEYHYETDNYKLLSLDDLDLIKSNHFIKLSKRFELGSWKNLPSEANGFLVQLIDIFNEGT